MQDEQLPAIQNNSFALAPLEEKEAGDLTVTNVFGSEENAQKTGALVVEFVESYEIHKHEKKLVVWLADEFRKFPTAWKDDQEIVQTANEVVASIQDANEKKASLYQHLEAGKSKESWLARQIETGAAAAGVINVGAYANGIDLALAASNTGMLETVSTQAGEISQNFNLDGFIAEQHHVSTFNIDAAAQGKLYEARVLRPEPGSSYGENSMDIGIYDRRTGQLLKRYQAKYGADADATKTLLDQGDYRGQRKLVPKGQAQEIEGAQEILECDGVKSKPLSKEEAKALQENAQRAREIKQYKWNDANRIQIAKQIGKQALIGAAATTIFQGGRILGRRIWNFLAGKGNRSTSEDMKEFFTSSIKSSAHVGVQVAVSGAIVVAAKNGWILGLLKNTPAAKIANIVYVGMENAKILYQYFQGKVNGAEALDAMGNITTVSTMSLLGAVGGTMAATAGMAKIGALLGTTVGPVGMAIGGFVGAVAGGIAGSSIGQAVYEGGKKLVTTAWECTKSTVSMAWEGAKSLFNCIFS